jgi:hypothetical protein
MMQIKKYLLVFTMTLALFGIALVGYALGQSSTGTLTVSTTSNNIIITVTGSGFDASGNVVLSLFNSDGTLAYSFTESITTDATGAFSANVALPTNVYGTFNLTASTSTVTGYTEYTISPALLSATPNDSNIIDVSGSNFGTSQSVSLGLTDNNGNIVYNWTEPVTTDAQGNFSEVVIVPTSINGTYNLFASTSGGPSSTTIASTTQTIPDLTGQTGATGLTGATGNTGATGATGAAGTEIAYAAVAVSIIALVIAAYMLTKKH